MKSRQKRMPAKKPKQQASNMTDTITLGGSDVDVIDLGDTMSSSWTSTSPYSFTSGSIDLGNTGAIGATGSITIPTTVTWSQDYTITGSTNNHYISIDSDGITMKEGADIMIGGKKLGEVISKIEERLAILRPNEELESKWEQLKELGRQYKELEKDILEKEKLMKILKET